MILRRINPDALRAAHTLHMDETTDWLRWLSLDGSSRPVAIQRHDALQLAG